MTANLTWEEQINLFTGYLKWLSMSNDKIGELFINANDTSTDLAAMESKQSIGQYLRLGNYKCRKSSSPVISISANYFLPKLPSWNFVTQEILNKNHRAVDFLPALTNHICNKYPLGDVQPTQTDCFHVYKHMTILIKPLNGIEMNEHQDVIWATPNFEDGEKSWFDTVLIHEDEQAEQIGIEGNVMIFVFEFIALTVSYLIGYHVAQVCIIFVLPEHYLYHKPLAYVEYFTAFTTQWQYSDFYFVKWSIKGGSGRREARVVALRSIWCSCHLIPVFGSATNPTWTADNVLEKCPSFYVNSYLDTDTFQIFIG